MILTDDMFISQWLADTNENIAWLRKEEKRINKTPCTHYYTKEKCRIVADSQFGKMVCALVYEKPLELKIEEIAPVKIVRPSCSTCDEGWHGANVEPCSFCFFAKNENGIFDKPKYTPKKEIKSCEIDENDVEYDLHYENTNGAAHD